MLYAAAFIRKGGLVSYVEADETALAALYFNFASTYLFYNILLCSYVWDSIGI